MELADSGVGSATVPPAGFNGCENWLTRDLCGAYDSLNKDPQRGTRLGFRCPDDLGRVPS
jgi:hypothetical protein